MATPPVAPEATRRGAPPATGTTHTPAPDSAGVGATVVVVARGAVVVGRRAAVAGGAVVEGSGGASRGASVVVAASTGRATVVGSGVEVVVVSGSRRPGVG